MDDYDDDGPIGCLLMLGFVLIAIGVSFYYSNKATQETLKNKQFDAIIFGEGQVVEIYSATEFALENAKGERKNVRLKHHDDKVVVKGDWWTIEAHAFDPDSPDQIKYVLKDKVK